MDRTIKYDHGKAVEEYFTAVLFVFQFYTVYNFGKKLSILDLALSGDIQGGGVKER